MVLCSSVRSEAVVALQGQLWVPWMMVVSMAELLREPWSKVGRPRLVEEEARSMLSVHLEAEAKVEATVLVVYMCVLCGALVEVRASIVCILLLLRNEAQEADSCRHA